MSQNRGNPREGERRRGALCSVSSGPSSKGGSSKDGSEQGSPSGAGTTRQDTTSGSQDAYRVSINLPVMRRRMYTVRCGGMMYVDLRLRELCKRLNILGATSDEFDKVLDLMPHSSYISSDGIINVRRTK